MRVPFVAVEGIFKTHIVQRLRAWSVLSSLATLHFAVC